MTDIPPPATHIQTPAPVVGIPHPDPDVSTADDTQVTYYEGSPKLRGELGLLFLWSLLGLVIIGITAAAGLGLKNGIVWWLWLAGIVIAFACWIIPGIWVRREFFRITNYRIDFERGLLFKNYDTVELWHVEDVSLHQGPLARIFNVGTIKIICHDATNPRFELSSVSDPRKLLEMLKTRIIAVKRQRGVMKVDAG